MNYQVELIEDWLTGSCYGVLEKQTGHLIKAFPDAGKATKLCQFLNNGGGFAGYSPAFVCAEPYYEHGRNKATYKTFTVER